MQPTGEPIFTWGLIILYVAAPLIQVYYGRKARPDRGAYSVTREAFRREGRLTFVAHAAVLMAMMGMIAADAASPGTLRSSALLLPQGIRWLGIVLGVLSLVGLIAVHRALGRYWSAYLEIQEGHRLVTSGIYSRVRHPMYTVLFAHTAALGLVSANWLFMLLCLTRMALLYNRIGKEEAMLIGRFGDEYRSYMQQTGRLLPRL